jgi:hypothetical protein
MPVIHLDLPSAEEEELIRRFTVNRHYLRAIAVFMSHTYGRGPKLFDGLQAVVSAHSAYARVRGGAQATDEVRRYLNLAWASEIQLALPAAMGNESIVAYANAWAPVHAYYSAFGGLQAWFAANGLSGTANDHTATLKTIANMIRERDLFPEPWNLLAVGCPMRGERKYLNIPKGADPAGKVEVLSIPNPLGADPMFWPRYGTWLRSTREARLRAREDDWKKRNPGAKNIKPAVRTKIAASVAPTSLFDCLWRLRIKSNYGDIDPYLVSRINEDEHVSFNSALRRVTTATMGLLELYVMRRVGRADYAAIATEFVSRDAACMTQKTLQLRMNRFGI